MHPVYFGPAGESFFDFASLVHLYSRLLQISWNPLAVYHSLNPAIQTVSPLADGEGQCAVVSFYGVPEFVHPPAMV